MGRGEVSYFQYCAQLSQENNYQIVVLELQNTIQRTLRELLPTDGLQ
jgi:hypothetical protein